MTIESLETRRLMTVFTVTNTDDNNGVNPAPGDGTGTLRQALVDANASTDVTNSIQFNIPDAANEIIYVTTSLPEVDTNVSIFGHNFDDSRITPTIEILGQPANNSTVEGLVLNGGNSIVDDLSIGGMDQAIAFNNPAAGGNGVFGCYVGVALDGVTAIANSVGINTTAAAEIGGVTREERNVISGNSSVGVESSSTVPSGGLVVQNSYIGVGADGSTAVANNIGLSLGSSGSIGGTGANQGNVISGNATSGLQFGGAGSATVEGNFIGTDATGTVSVPNQEGIYLTYASSITIGGTTAGARNIISGNTDSGIYLFGVGGSNQILGNYIGTDVTGLLPIANAGNGISLLGSSAPVQIGATGAGNVIAGNAGDGIYIRPNPIDNSSTANAIISDNLIGVGADGGNTLAGTPFSRGDGNGEEGIEIDEEGHSSNTPQATILGNTIANSQIGIYYYDGASVTIGGSGANDGNLIEGNSSDGILANGDPVYAPTTATVRGNQIVSNSIGIELINDANSQIGGTASGDGNLISGNSQYGVEVGLSVQGASLQGNRIGTTADGTSAMPNLAGGVLLENSSGILVGGTAAGAGNVISGNAIVQVELVDASSNLIQGNIIGPSADGRTALSGARTNTADGIDLTAGQPPQSSDNNSIGGSVPAAGNVIAYNRTGVRLYYDGATNNSIRYNSIYSNGIGATGGGIIFDGQGGSDTPTPNDPGDSDTGANTLQNSPVVVTATLATGQLSVLTTLNSTPNTSFLIDFYSGAALDSTGSSEGQNYVGTSLVTTDANGNATFTPAFASTLSGTQYVTATATTVAGSPAGDTSQISPSVLMTVAPPATGGGGGGGGGGTTTTPTITIGNVTQSATPGNFSAFTFLLSRSGDTSGTSTVAFTTQDGTAKVSTGDYDPAAGTITFAPGVTSQNITVDVFADPNLYPTAKFYVDLSNPTNGTVSSAIGVGTINEPAPATPPSTGSVSGQVTGGPGGGGETIYLDANNNKILDSGELSTITATGGTYSFSNVPAGAYIVRQVLPAGYKQVTPTDNTGDHITVSAGSTLTNENFTDAVSSTGTGGTGGGTPTTGNSITGSANGGKAGETIYLDANNNKTLDAGERSTTTNSKGFYSFSNVPVGSYIIRQILPAGYAQVTPTSNTGLHISIAAKQTLTNENFTDKVTATPTKLSGNVIGTAGSYNNSGNTIAKAVDGSLSTFFDAAPVTGVWVGLDLGTAKVATQVRFAPRSGYASRMLGGVFQASNTADFSSGVVTLATITSTPVAGSLTTLSLNNTTAYRYYRYLSPDHSHGDIAELEFDG